MPADHIISELFKGCLPQILPGSFLNTLIQISKKSCLLVTALCIQKILVNKFARNLEIQKNRLESSL